MNNIAIMNESTFNYLKKTFVFQFKDFHFSNNVITFNGEAINLKDFELQEILNYNSYVITDLTEQEIFDIIKVHADVHNKLSMPTKATDKTSILSPIVISGENNSKQETDLINMDRFIVLTRKDEDYTEENKKEIDRFFELYKRLVLFEDFLTPSTKSKLDDIKNLLKNLEVEIL